MTTKKATKTETTKVTNEVKQNDFQTISENLEFHDFEKEPVFTGIFEQQITLGEKEPFQVNIMFDSQTGARVFVTNAYAIEKAIANVKSNHTDLSKIEFRFEYLGKTEKNGKPFNMINTAFRIIE